MYCGNCGEVVAVSDNYCRHCGKKVVQTSGVPVTLLSNISYYNFILAIFFDTLYWTVLTKRFFFVSDIEMKYNNDVH